MFCSKCGAQISDDSNFCYKCGNKISVNKEQESVENNIEQENNCDIEEVDDRLWHIHTFLSDIISSNFNMSKKEYTTSEGICQYCDFLEKVLMCLDEKYVSEKYVTRKTIEEYASNVDGFLYEILTQYPQIKYIKEFQDCVDNMAYWGIQLTEDGHLEFEYEDSDNNHEGMPVKIKEKRSVYSSFKKELFTPVDNFKSKYKNNWKDGSPEEIKEKTDALNTICFFLSFYGELLSVINQIICGWVDIGKIQERDIEEILNKYPADKAIYYDRTIYEKKYKHFGVDFDGSKGFNILNINQRENILSFEMWDADDVTQVGICVDDNDYYDVNGNYYPELFEFEMIKCEQDEDWSAGRESFVSRIQIRAISNYTPEMINLKHFWTNITVLFTTNIETKMSDEMEISVFGSDE